MPQNEREKVKETDVVKFELTNDELDICIENAKKIYKIIEDRADLHKRDILERFENVLIGEVAEHAVKKWLNDNGKYVKSVVDKNSPSPDPGHDIEIKAKDGKTRKCSIKSSLSFHYSSPERILSNMTIATKKSEVRDVNIQVYFWYNLRPNKDEARTTLPTIKMAAIMCWFTKEDLNIEFDSYNHEERESPTIKLENGRPMKELLYYLI